MADYRQQAYDWAGPGREAMVDAIADFLHFNESLHMHEDIEAKCCAYCWLRAGKAIRALVNAGVEIGAKTTAAPLHFTRDSASGLCGARPVVGDTPFRASFDAEDPHINCPLCRMYLRGLRDAKGGGNDA